MYIIRVITIFFLLQLKNTNGLTALKRLQLTEATVASIIYRNCHRLFCNAVYQEIRYLEKVD